MAEQPSVVPSVPLMLDKERHLRFTIPALLMAERELSRIWEKKVSLFATIGSAEGLGLNDMQVLLWVALLHEEPGLTLLRVQDMMDLSKVGDYITAIYAAWNAAWPLAPAQPEGAESPLALTSTGSVSGSTAA